MQKPTALSILVVIVYFSVTSRDAGERGHCFPCSFKREATGAEVPFHNRGIWWLTRSIWNKFIAAIHAPTTFRMFSTLPVIIFEVNIFAKQKQTDWWMIFWFLEVYISLNTSTAPPCPTAATCVLSNSIYKVSIATDMIGQTKLLTQSQWR